AGKAINVGPASLTVSGTTQILNSGVLNVDTGAANVAASGNATASHFRATTLTIDGTATVAPGGNNNGMSVVNSLVFNGSGSIDFNDNDLMVNYSGTSPLPTLQTLINQGRNGGAWNGASLIRSSSARNANPANTTLAAMEGVDYKAVASGIFDGTAVSN